MMAVKRILLILCCSVTFAQSAHDEWKTGDFNLQALLTWSLADAPLTIDERRQVNRLFDDDFEKTTAEGRIGMIALTDGDREHLILQGSGPWCGATGNCSVWILARANGHLEVVLETIANGLSVSRSLHYGFRDVITTMHGSAFETQYTVYRYDGKVYQPVDCYSVLFDREGRDVPPEVQLCHQAQ